MYIVMVKPKEPNPMWVELTGIEYESKWEAEQELEYEMTMRGEEYYDGIVKER